MSLDTSLSVVIPTPGQGRPLEQTLRSINHQRSGEDEVIIVHDCVDGVDPEVRRLANWYGCVYLESAATEHDWGHTQGNEGIAAATKAWVVGQDDDDIFMPDAFRRIRARITLLDEPQPLMFRFMTPWRMLLWHHPVLQVGLIGGHCLVTPNLPGRIGRWTSRYEGDFDLIRSTVDLWPGGEQDIVWCEDLISWTRPTPEEAARLVPVGVAV